jgi:hypothetical protein
MQKNLSSLYLITPLVNHQHSPYSDDSNVSLLMKNIKRPKNVICVLGMHRSGTSALTGSLQACGLTLGEHHTWNRHNQKGNRENQGIVDLHEAVLTTNHGSWDSPPKKVQWLPSQVETASSILAENHIEEFWGFKDPRALLCINEWKRLVPDMQFIGIFRHPLAVATSLNRRGEISVEQGLLLWYHYNKLLLKQYRKSKFPLLCFDWEQDEFEQKLTQAALDLGLKKITNNDFYTKSLRHHEHSSNSELPWRTKRLYQKLKKLSSY